MSVVMDNIANSISWYANCLQFHMHVHASKAACTQILFWKQQHFHIHTERVAKLRWCADLAQLDLSRDPKKSQVPPYSDSTVTEDDNLILIDRSSCHVRLVGN